MRSLLSIFLFLTPFIAFAQPAEEVELNTPYASIYNHLHYLQEESYDPELAALSMDPSGITAKQRVKRAIMLKQVLDGRGYYIVMDDLPISESYVDSLSKKNRYYPVETNRQIFLEREGDKWRYSEVTVAAVDAMHSEVYPYGTGRLLNLLPKFGSTKFLGLHLWQYLGMAILLVFFALFHRLLSFVLKEFLSKLLLRLGFERLAREFVYKVARPLSIMVILSMLLVLVPVLQLSVEFNAMLLLLIRIIRPLFLVLVLWRLVNVLAQYLMLAAEKTESTLDDQLIPLVRKFFQGLVIIIGLLWTVSILGVNITALLAGVSIGGLALALAAQDTIKHLFGSFMIFVDRPFQIGDWIVAGEIDGAVEQVGFRSTRVRTFHNSVVSVPNGKLADMTIDNMGLRQYRRLKTNIAVTYDTPPAVIEKFQVGIRQLILDHPDTWKGLYHVYLNNMSAYSLDILLFCFFSVPDWGAELKARNELLQSIILLADELGVRFAFPTQTLHMESFPEREGVGNSQL